MKKLHIAIIGFGQLGKACARMIQESADLSLVGVVQKESEAITPFPKRHEKIPVAGHVSELGQVDAALICVSTEAAQDVSHDILQRGIPIVECASLEAKAFDDYFEELDRVAIHHRVAAIVGAGWSPGVLPRLQEMFNMLIPKGHTTMTNRPGINLHHSAALAQIDGVKDAMCTETHGTAPTPRHYVYLELHKGAVFDKVQKEVLADPLFVAEQTQVFQVESIAAMEDEGHGILIERKGMTGTSAHETLVFEARYEPTNFTARIMLDAVHMIPYSRHGATRYSPLR